MSRAVVVLHEGKYHADDHCIGQSWLEIAAYDDNPVCAESLKQVYDTIIANPHTGSLDFKAKDCQKRWSWCDALFMMGQHIDVSVRGTDTLVVYSADHSKEAADTAMKLRNEGKRTAVQLRKQGKSDADYRAYAERSRIEKVIFI